jgi:signal transduction histidine kinase
MRAEARGWVQRHGDEALAAALTLPALAELALHNGPIGLRLLAAAGTVLVGVCAARRVRAPLTFLAALFAVSVSSVFLPKLFLEAAAFDEATDGSGMFPFLLLALYSAAAHTRDRDTVIAGSLTVSLFVMDLVFAGQGITVDVVVFLALIFGAPWVAGTAVRRRAQSEGRLAQERERAAIAIADERSRIARELHDVVAHSISVMILQARGGRRVLETEPADAREAFANIERTGRQSLDEMRRLLGMLRESDEVVALAPQPSLKELGTLVEQVRAAGLPVELQIEGAPRELPPGVDLSAFRIVQEALTNALKHAGPARARVLLRYLDDDLELEIADDGAGGGETQVPGYGLVGMRERVGIYGGEMEAGRRPEGGYALRVRLPLGSVRA